jgi:hypothetical protein
VRRAYIPAVRFPRPPRLLTLLPEVKVPFPRSYGAGELRLRLPEPFQLVVGEMPDLEGGPGIAHDLREIELILELKPREPPALCKECVTLPRGTPCALARRKRGPRANAPTARRSLPLPNPRNLGLPRDPLAKIRHWVRRSVRRPEAPRMTRRRKTHRNADDRKIAARPACSPQFVSQEDDG